MNFLTIIVVICEEGNAAGSKRRKMSLKEMINHSFSQQTYEDWKQKAEESLKGKTVEILARNTYENIQLKPLYTKEDLGEETISQFPGSGDYRRGSSALGYIGETWKIAQRIDTSNLDVFKERLTSSFQKGQTAIAFTPSLAILKELPQLLTDCYDRYPFSVNGENYQGELINFLVNMPQSSEVTGYVGKDPVSLYAKEWRTTEDMDAIYGRWYKTIQLASQACPKLKTILVDTTTYHNGGANAVQELAVALSTAVYHIEQLRTQGMGLEDILGKMVFHFSIGSNFFLEVAKLRAARVLWGKITEAYGSSAEKQGQMIISADTSWFTKTAYDPYVNLLRAGNEAFAAVLGGVQYLHVSPFNEPEGEASTFSDRIARNTQLLLRNEARLGAVVDPAGGSFYVESLTDQLVENAWSLFLEIDEMGGIVEALNTKWLQRKIKEVKAKRDRDIFTRKQSIVGTNKYANLKDEPLNIEFKDNVNQHLTDVQPILAERLAEPYEKLRKRAEKLAKANKEPVIGLICLGKLKNHKVRADFISGFLAPGGMATEKSGEIEEIHHALNFINETKRDFYFLCGSDSDYERLGVETVQAIKGSFPEVKLYLAGFPSEDEQKALSASGISQFIHAKSNCYETLAFLLNEMEVE